jgi:N-glycosylase/DNA lyase
MPKPEICIPTPEIEAKIKKALADFKKVWESDTGVYEELCFCLLTPQSSAKQAMKTIVALKRHGLLEKGTAAQKEPFVRNVRFFRTKAKRLEEAQKKFAKKKLKKMLIKNGLPHDAVRCREFLRKEVNGYGLKESSHFLRNIGFGADVAILDRHILKNLAKCGVMGEVQKHMSDKAYLEIERKMKAFCEKHGMNFAELDLVFWSNEAGDVLK